MVYNQDENVQKLAEKLVTHAIEKQSRDNVTVMVVAL
jgi:serine/threonine protein phosphatase PrpC